MVNFYFLWSSVNVIMNSRKDRPHSFLYKLHTGTTGFLLDSWTLKRGPICRSELLVRNYHYLLRNNPEQHSSDNIPYSDDLNNWSTSLDRNTADPLQNFHQDAGSEEHRLRATTQDTIPTEWLALMLAILENTCLILIRGDGYLDPVPSCFFKSRQNERMPLKRQDHFT